MSPGLAPRRQFDKRRPLPLAPQPGCRVGSAVTTLWGSDPRLWSGPGLLLCAPGWGQLRILASWNVLRKRGHLPFNSRPEQPSSAPRPRLRQQGTPQVRLQTPGWRRVAWSW